MNESMHSCARVCVCVSVSISVSIFFLQLLISRTCPLAHFRSCVFSSITPLARLLSRTLAFSRVVSLSIARLLALALALALSPSRSHALYLLFFHKHVSFPPVLSLSLSLSPPSFLCYSKLSRSPLSCTPPLLSVAAPPLRLFLMFLLLCNNIYTLSGLDPKTTTIFTKPPTELAQTNLHAKPPPQDSCKRIPLRPATHIHSHTRTI